jgi:hypothetical protein
MDSLELSPRSREEQMAMATLNEIAEMDLLTVAHKPRPGLGTGCRKPEEPLGGLGGFSAALGADAATAR